MEVKKIIIIAIALVSGVLAVLLVLLMNRDNAATKVVAHTEVSPPAPEISLSVVEVLVAARDLAPGDVLSAQDMRWQGWPQTNLPAHAVIRQNTPDILPELAGTIVRASVSSGEPISQSRLIRSNGGYLATVLQPGMRAVAVALDAKGNKYAGGFIRPMDRVDVIVTKHGMTQSPLSTFSTTAAEVLVRDVRVLAIGPQLSASNDKGLTQTVMGDTATIEVSASQAALLAETIGAVGVEVSLALRPFGEGHETPSEQPTKERIITIRYGNLMP